MEHFSEHEHRARLGTTIADGKYKLLELLGSGAMGAVFKACHVELQRHVAIKVMHAMIMEMPQAPERFKREARAASRLRHRNSIEILDFGAENGEFFLVMEHIPGRQLFDVVLDEGRLTPQRAVGLMAQILGALGAAHDQGVVHRDIKAENILVSDTVDDDGNPTEIVKVLDFGIAKILTREEGSKDRQLTREGQVAGTPGYMSPEQAQGTGIDHRSDIYSCGVLLFMMLTGELPYDAETDMGLMIQHVTAPVPDPRAINPRLSERLGKLVMQCLAKSPADRPQSARELRVALKNAVGMAAATTDEKPAAAPAPLIPQGTRPHQVSGATAADVDEDKKRPAWLWVAVVLLAVGASGVVGYLASGGGGGDDSAVVAERQAKPVATKAAPSSGTSADAGAKPAPGPAPSKAPEAVTPPAAPAAAKVEETAAEKVPTPAPAKPVAAPEAKPSEPSKAVAEVAAVAPAEPAKTVAPLTPRERRLAARRAKKKAKLKKTRKAEPAASSAAKPAEAPKPATAAPVSPAPKATIAPPKPTPVAEPKPAPKPEPKPEPKKPEAPKMMTASVSVGGLSTRGSLSSGTVGRAVRSRSGAYKACFAKAAAAAGNGRKTSVKVSLTIDEDGFAGRIKASGGFGSLASCIKAAVSRVRTHKRPDTGVVDSKFTLHFK